jgi:integrase
MYQKAIPKFLRQLGTQFNQYIRAANRTEAAQIAAALAVRDAALVRVLKNASEEERKVYLALGADGMRKALTLPPVSALLAPVIADPIASGNFVRMALVTMREASETMLSKVEALDAEIQQSIALTAEPAADYTFLGLFQHWAKGGARKPRHYESTAKLLTKCYGNIDYRSLNPANKDGHKFATWMAERVNGEPRIAPASQQNHLERGRALFKAAERNGLLDHANPFEKVAPRDAYHARQKGKFTHQQLAAMLRVVEEQRFGDTRQQKRHLEVLWILRLCVWTGARVNEIASLRKSSVLRHKDGFPYLYFRADAVKAKAGEDRSRETPLHPALWDKGHPDFIADFEAYAMAAKQDHIFGAFEDNKDNGRAAWMISNFPAFLREHAAEIDIALKDGVPVDHKERPLTLHCIRHSYHRAIMDARLSGDAQRILTGHAGADVHEGVYATDMGLPLLYEDVCRVRPLG